MSQVTYNKAAILESADRVITNAASMLDDKTDVTNRTAALLNEFSGINATIYGDHQHQFIQAFGHLIDTVDHFGKTVQVVVGDASDIDQMLSQQV
jgi:uncharacterized protein YukE